MEVRKRTVSVMLCLLFLLSSLSGLSTAYSGDENSENIDESSGGDYIIFRGKVKTMYIVNESIEIQTKTTVFRDGKPTSESSSVEWQITGVNSDFGRSGVFRSESNQLETTYLPMIEETGHYKIRMVPKAGDLSGSEKEEGFGVNKPPVPYTISFTDDGSKAIFSSKKLNESGQTDGDYPFKLVMYHYSHGEGESKINTWKNITEMTIDIKKEYRDGTVIIHVFDKWGWQNSDNMDLDNNEFGGKPIKYDYTQEDKYPLKSRSWLYYVTVVGGMVISVAVIIKIWPEEEGY